MNQSRRDVLKGIASLGTCGLLRSAASSQDRLAVPRRLFGLQAYSYGIRFRQVPGSDDPLQLIQLASDDGFASVQLRLGTPNDETSTRIRDLAERLRLTLEGLVNAPMTDAENERFENDLRIHQAAGIDVVRTVVSTGRRYETFRSADEFRQFQTRARQTMIRMARAADRQRVKVAVENHKDFRTPEFVEILRRLDSEHLGVCLDTGNNIALLEDAWHTVDSLTPYTFTVHLKDMAVESADNGFLLAEVPLGRGVLDLRRVIDRIHRAKPHARFHLEMITRNPLSIPCLTEDYWRTMSDVPGVDLARSLAFVRRHGRPANDLPRLDRLNAAEQIRVEREHIIRSREWAHEHIFRAT
jgi:sugar phosphate isomerase/epimerase